MTVEKKEKLTVTMTDGRVVEFGVKAKFHKEVLVEGAAVNVRFDFRNGETRTFTVPEHQFSNAAGHGYSQKLGDWVAGMKNEDGSAASLDDIILEIEALATTLEGRDSWNRTAAEGGAKRSGGTSILLRAMVEATGKDAATVKAFLSTKSQAEKLALRKSSRLAPIVRRLEEEKAARSGKEEDGDALLDALENK